MLVPELPIEAELKSIYPISRYRQLKIDIFLLNARFVFLNILYDIRINTEESVSQSVPLTHDHSILIHSIVGQSVSQSISHSVSRAVGQSVSQSASQPASRLASQLVNESVSLSVCLSFCLSAYLSVPLTQPHVH
jgi:hypothetical protein